MSTIPRVADMFLSADASIDAFPVPEGDLILTGVDYLTGQSASLRITPETARALAAWLLATA